MEFSRQEYCSGLPCPHPGDLPHPGIKPTSCALQVDSLASEPPENQGCSYLKIWPGLENLPQNSLMWLLAGLRRSNFSLTLPGLSIGISIVPTWSFQQNSWLPSGQEIEEQQPGREFVWTQDEHESILVTWTWRYNSGLPALFCSLLLNHQVRPVLKGKNNNARIFWAILVAASHSVRMSLSLLEQSLPKSFLSTCYVPGTLLNSWIIQCNCNFVKNVLLYIKMWFII